MNNINLAKEDSLTFLEFMMANGFNPNNYENILELIQSVPNSMSKYLKFYNQFLLSDKVKYDELENYQINGALGHLDENGIFIPKTLEADSYFEYNRPKVLGNTHRYIYPDISEFDSIIAYCDFSVPQQIEQMITSLKYINSNMYLGFTINKNIDNFEKILEIISFMVMTTGINKYITDEHTIAHDTISKQNKEFFLIKRK